MSFSEMVFDKYLRLSEFEIRGRDLPFSVSFIFNFDSIAEKSGSTERVEDCSDSSNLPLNWNEVNRLNLGVSLQQEADQA